MTANPYIAQHYGSSMAVMSNGHEDEVDASVGFRRFPNAPHMTHTVFRPSRSTAPAHAAAPSPSAMGIRSTYQSTTPDAMASMRLHKGGMLDPFPSRPQTPRSTTSNASLPPLLPHDRHLVGPHDMVRDGAAGLLREWVKPSPHSTPTSSSRDGNNDGGGVNGDAYGVPEGRDAFPVRRYADGQYHTRLPAVSAAPAAVDVEPSVSVSPVSPRLAHSKLTTASSASHTPPEPPNGLVTVDAALQRSRNALAQAELLLDDAPAPPPTRPLPPPPPLTVSDVAGYAPPPQKTSPPAPAAPLASHVDEATTWEDAQDYLSPLSNGHLLLHTASQAERRVSVAASAAPVAAPLLPVTTPIETARFMVLCTVADPPAVAAQRLRRRGPTWAVRGNGGGSSAAMLSTGGAHAASAARHPSPRRIAEVQSRRTAAAARDSSPASAATASRQAQRSRSLDQGCDALQAAGAAAAPQQATSEAAANRLLREDPRLLQELAEFLRAGNPRGFSSLSAATQTAQTAQAGISPSARNPRRRSAPAAPAVLQGHPPPSSPQLRRYSSGTAPSHTDRAATPSSRLPRTNTEGSATAAEVSPRRGSARARRVEAMPSYAQPTLSWLSKGSEASADEFPLSRSASPQTSPLKDLAMAEAGDASPG
ncbi:hypothetical protein NESM_000152400 [Novymonas esmeraldas]|uniref:Uncharacterized protein n=1 Tax=Novymonas esmeraldas TaxID=1808958 RepID=A0AAW0F2Y4_9TRYP